MISAALILGGLILGGCTLIATRLEEIGDAVRRANDLKEAELRSRNVAITEPGSTAD
jgi:hypothetical protein